MSPTPTPSPTPTKRRKLPLTVKAKPATKPVKRAGVTTVVRRAKTTAKGNLAIRVRFRPKGAAAAGEVPYGRAYIARNGRVKVRTFGYPRMRVTVVVKALPRKSAEEQYKANSWRRTWRTR